ncbi:conserved hypothetical protein [Solidesulfovibrio fructosivorans JJ]]|uniref:Uncharacterized protein n=1 Tax=Solidesulfovibrio fructosivorans JJ] TaxID=596151 RepID=E1JW12_SOLFR|nr:hypothetical protein [Solidesulfovibrio fructosivorans]EFL51372.1 conserved hypothetical protein [Solidesulfovibrio fructosivorans JJ]]
MDTPIRLFPPGQGISPYLADWRKAFADLDPTRAVTVSFCFDRGKLPPVIETVCLPWPVDAADRPRVELFSAAVVNNVLCLRGARRVSILADDAALARNLAEAIRRLFILGPDDFSDMSLIFLLRLVERVFGADFTIDADRDHALALLRDHCRLDASDETPPAGPTDIRPGTVLAVNIGQHLTSQALVRCDGAGGYAVESFSRRPTRDDQGERMCLNAVLPSLRAEAKALAKQAGRPIDAVGVSLSATVVAGKVRPVPEFGLFAECGETEIHDADATLRRTFGDIFPGRPVAVVNDGEAQALFAFHYGRPEAPLAAGAARPGGVLSVRLGSCPAIHVLDASGHAGPGFHEYGWLITRYAPNPAQSRLFSTSRFHLSHYGVALAAHELGLLARYGQDIETAIPFFHDALVGDDLALRLEAAGVYGVLGAHLAMLAEEVSRQTPLGSLRLLGSRANHVDAPVFAAMAKGFAAFASGHALSVSGLPLRFIEDASSFAGLVGAAHAALRLA